MQANQFTNKIDTLTTQQTYLDLQFGADAFSVSAPLFPAFSATVLVVAGFLFQCMEYCALSMTSIPAPLTSSSSLR
jgi:hypothetical protein